MIGNTGTYVDMPSHRWANGVDLAGMPLDRLADLPGTVVRVPAGTRAVDRLMLAPYEVAGRAVLLHTGWDEHFGTDRYGDPTHPYLTVRLPGGWSTRGVGWNTMGVKPVR